jgi:ribonuclease Z
MYGEKEKLAKAKEYKHMTFYEAAQLAKDARVSELWLTHYSPSLMKPEEYMEEVRRIFPYAKAGKDRMSKVLTFEGEEVQHGSEEKDTNSCN